MKSDVVKLVTFRLGGDLFATDVASVDRVLRYEAPSAVPEVPAWVSGVIEHRGKVVPVIDLRRRIELADQSITHETRVLVLNTEGGYVGAIVDAVLEVVSVPADGVEPPPALFRGFAARFLRGIARVNGKLVVMLDVNTVLANADRIVLDRALQGVETTTRG
jgi:purine-binding chemotaxis protein CheW